MGTKNLFKCRHLLWHGGSVYFWDGRIFSMLCQRHTSRREGGHDGQGQDLDGLGLKRKPDARASLAWHCASHDGHGTRYAPVGTERVKEDSIAGCPRTLACRFTELSAQILRGFVIITSRHISHSLEPWHRLPAFCSRWPGPGRGCPLHLR